MFADTDCSSLSLLRPVKTALGQQQYSFDPESFGVDDDNQNIKPSDIQSFQPGRWKLISGGTTELSSDITYYISSTSLNTNDGLNPDTAFATIQKFVDTAVTFNTGGHSIIGKIAHGTYEESVQLKPFYGGGRIMRLVLVLKHLFVTTLRPGIYIYRFESFSLYQSEHTSQLQPNKQAKQ